MEAERANVPTRSSLDPSSEASPLPLPLTRPTQPPVAERANVPTRSSLAPAAISDPRFAGLFFRSLGFHFGSRFAMPARRRGFLGVIIFRMPILRMRGISMPFGMTTVLQVELAGFFQGMLLATGQSETEHGSRNSEKAQRFHAGVFSPDDAALQPPTRLRPTPKTPFTPLRIPPWSRRCGCPRASRSAGRGPSR